MKIVFIGVVNIGWHCLRALLESSADVAGIFTADKKAMVQESHMHADYFSEFEGLALKYGVPLYKISNVSVPLDTRRLRELQPDIIFCIGWPQIVKKEVLEIPKLGCVGIHPTLLPKRRGGAPINWCLIDGLTKGGVTLFYFDEGVDSGDIIDQKEFEISFVDTAKTLLDKVTSIAGELVREYYPLLARGTAPRLPQDDAEATYTRRRRPEDGAIDWRRTSLSIYNWVRALTLPFPGAFTFFQGRRVVIWESELLAGYRARLDTRQGEVLAGVPGKGMVVTTSDNCILIKRVEVGGEQMKGNEFMQRFEVSPGSILGE